jgi:hypothetical protein
MNGQQDGKRAYGLAGWIFIGCGILWILISLIPITCKTPVKECMWMWIVGASQLILGTALLALKSRSAKFQMWADQDYAKYLKQKEQLEQKVKVGRTTLPMTNGDVLALKFLGVIVIVLIVWLAVGSAQGWVVWK